MQSNTCPVEKIPYTGQCKVLTCPANHKKAESGCILQDIKEISMFSVGSYFKMANPDIKRKYKKGVKILTDTAKFYHLASQNYTNTISFCANCGVEGPNCLNIIRCNKRKKIAVKQCKKLPMLVLNNPTPTIFWSLITQPSMEQFFKPALVKRSKKLLTRIQANIKIPQS
jgi:hypothetical protein